MRSKITYLLTVLMTMLHATLGTPILWAQTPVGTSFLYQGSIEQVGLPANGDYDFEFALFDAADSGAQVSSTLTVDDLLVDDGLFSVELDFGANTFIGDALWLEIAVREGVDNGPYTTLSPRQRLAATPFAIHSDHADLATVSESAELLDGRDSSEFLLTSGGTISGDLTVEGAFIGELDPASLPTVTAPSAYIPARLLCGNLAEPDATQWSFITSALKIMIDGADFELSVGFAGAATMGDVAASIQTALRAATGRQEVVSWSDDHFEIQSADTTSTSSISPAMSPRSAPGIDISGETVGNDWMDCDAERAQVVDSTPNPGIYEGDIPLLDASGNIDHRFIPDTAAAALTGQVYQIEEVAGPGRHVIEIPLGFIGVDTYELLAIQTLRIDPPGGCERTDSATLMKLKGKVGGPFFALYREGTDGDCPPNPLVNTDLTITPFGNPSITSSLSAFDRTACRGGECVHSSIQSISALPDGNNLLIEIDIEEDNVSAFTDWRYTLNLRYLYAER